MNAATAFSKSYAEARERFLSAVREAGLTLENHVNPAGKGAQGEELATDVAIFGAADWKKAILVSSGTHGVEGFCGSGCQGSLLRDEGISRLLERERIALILVHAVNPYGFSHLHRTNEDNIDLNRNFYNHAAGYPANDGYDALHEWLMPAAWPPDIANEQALMAAQSELRPELRARLSSGQVSHPDGLFYAGRQPAWSNRTIRDLLRRHAGARRSLAWIDIHTGLGPYGHGEKIFGSADEATVARARRWWGKDLIQSSNPDSVVSRIAGYITPSARQECPNAAVTAMTLEYGTLPQNAVRLGLRGDAWLRRHPDAPESLRREIKQMLRDAFYIDSDDWKGMILGQFRAVMLQTIYGLAE